MSERPRKPSRRKSPRQGEGAGARRPQGGGLSARKNAQGEWVLTHPPCCRERSEDLEEVHAMIEAGELEVAADELHWLLAGCPELLEAHVLLGELAVELGGDLPLARGHFGFAYESVLKALERAGCTAGLPGSLPANAPFFLAARGLAWCLEKLGQGTLADAVVATARRFDPSDPAGVAEGVDGLRTAGLPIVELLPPPNPPAP